MKTVAPSRWLACACLAALALLVAASPAHAIAYYGILQYTPPAPPDSLDGLFVESPGAQQWVNYTVTLEWWVTNDDPSQPGYPWKYTYRFRHNGNQAGFSHVVVEAAPDFAASDMTALTGAILNSIALQRVSSGNPGMPEDVYGIRFDPPASGMFDMTWTFYSTRAPVWGDFYGRCGGAGGINRAYNYNLTGGVARGFLDPNGSDTLRDDTDPTGAAANGSLDYHILRPGPAGAPVPVLTTSPEGGGTLQFGYVLVGTPSTQGLTVVNSGGPGSSLTGTFPAASGDFTPGASQAFGPLAQGASDARNYVYAPATRGLDTELVTVASNGGNSTITLTGTGVAPISSVDDTGGNAGLVRVGTTGTATVIVRNTGNGNLSDPTDLTDADNLHGTGPSGAGDFTLVGSGTINLPDNTPQTLTYNYTPATRGSDTEPLNISFSNGNPNETNTGHQQPFTLLGQAVGPVFDSIPVPNSIIDFGRVLVGDFSTADFDVGNVSPDPNGGNASLTNLTLVGYEIVGADAALFSLIGFAPGTVITAGSLFLDLELRFDAADPMGLKTATLRIFTDEGAPLGGSGRTFEWELRGVSMPEPATLSVLGVGALLLLARRRRR